MRVFLGHPDSSSRRILATTLEVLDHTIVGQTDTAKELIECCVADPPEMIVSAVQYQDLDGITALVSISEHVLVPSIVVAKDDDLQQVERAMDDHVMAYLVEPVTKDDLRPTMFVVRRRFEQFEALRKENAELRNALVVRKKVERAKGILMRLYDIDEEAAFLRLQKSATSQRAKLETVADDIIASARAGKLRRGDTANQTPSP